MPNKVMFDCRPYCSEHGAMNMVSKHGMWRCLVCHIGFDESKNMFFKDSTEGFRTSNYGLKCSRCGSRITSDNIMYQDSPILCEKCFKAKHF